MTKAYKIKVIKDINCNINDSDYTKGEEFTVVDIFPDKNSYARYYNETLDWIPKHYAEIIEEGLTWKSQKKN